MGSSRSTSATPALAVATAANIDHRVHVYRAQSRKFGDEAATILGGRLGVSADRICKTLVVAARSNAPHPRPELALAVLPVTRQLNLKAVAAALGWPGANLAEVALAEKATGYIHGGISPLGTKRTLRCVIDESVADWPTIMCSAGRRGWEIELSPHDLRAATNAQWAPIGAHP